VTDVRIHMGHWWRTKAIAECRLSSLPIANCRLLWLLRQWLNSNNGHQDREGEIGNRQSAIGNENRGIW